MIWRQGHCNTDASASGPAARISVTIILPWP